MIQTPNFDPNNRIEVYLAAILEELREHRKQAVEIMKRAEAISRDPVRWVMVSETGEPAVVRQKPEPDVLLEKD